MATYVKDAGVWKLVNAIHVKQSGLWKQVQQAYVQQDGVHKAFFALSASLHISATSGGSQITTLNEGTGYFLNVIAYVTDNTVLKLKFVAATGYTFISAGDVNPPELVSSSANVTITNNIGTLSFSFVGDVTTGEGTEYFVAQLLDGNNVVLAQTPMITVNDSSLCRWPQWGLC